MKFQEFFAQIFSVFNVLYYSALFLCNFTIKIKIKLLVIAKLFDSNCKVRILTISDNDKSSNEEEKLKNSPNLKNHEFKEKNKKNSQKNKNKLSNIDFDKFKEKIFEFNKKKA